MGTSRLLIIALVVLVPSVAFAQAGPGPLPAADLEKQGLDLYKAGNYAAAVDPLRRAYEMEPNKFDYRLAYAQALAKSGQCGEAKPHFKALQDSATDPAAKQNVRTAAEACPEEPAPAPAPPRPAPPPLPAPEATSGGGISGTTAFMLFGAGAGIAAGACLFAAARWDYADADAARSFDDHVRLSNRGDRLTIAAAVAGGVGITLGVISIVRLRQGKERSTDIALTPRGDGGTVVVRGTW